MLTLDGSYGEGGGQILRTALALAATLERPVTLTRIRARRPKPGLQPQHVAVVRALAAITGAETAGDVLGSSEVRFVPRAPRAGEHRFDVGAVRGSAGSVTLLFQALLLPLVFARGTSRLTLIGGTHVPWSPPFHYVSEVFLPALAALGIEAGLTLHRWGWYPAGGGEVAAVIQPARGLAPFVASAGPPPGPVSGLSAASRLPRSIADRQRRRALDRLAAAGLPAEIAIAEDASGRSPGTVLFLAMRGRAGFSALGRRGVPAERVADEAVDALLAFRASGAAVDDHLADQLVPFLALARDRSTLSCQTVSPHLHTVLWVVRQIAPVEIEVDDGLPARLTITPQRSP